MSLQVGTLNNQPHEPIKMYIYIIFMPCFYSKCLALHLRHEGGVHLLASFVENRRTTKK